MESNCNKQDTATSGTGRPVTHKAIPTVVTATYTGDQKAVARQAEIKKPDNPEEVIAKNTKQTVCRCQHCGE